MENREKRIIVIPAYNEEKTIHDVLQNAITVSDRVLVVDDGSTDRTAEIAEASGACVIRHSVNRGLGGALGTGIAGALELGADLIVTMDADGQHQAEDAKRVFDHLEQHEVDFVIGSRMLEDGKGMPMHRKLANGIGNALTWMLFGLWVTDSQSGLRGMTRYAAEKIELKTNRMEVSSEFVKEIKEKQLVLAEIPIEVIYTEYSLSKGQGFGTGLRTAGKLILRKLIK